MTIPFYKISATALALAIGATAAHANASKPGPSAAMTERAASPVKEESKARRGAPVRVIPIYNVTKVAVCLPGPSADCAKR